MAFFLVRKFREFKAEALNEFYTDIEELLQDKMVQKLDNYIQHYCYTRLKHSLDVAYYSYLITRMFGWDSRSTARAGLLHDLFLYDWRDDDYTGKNHAMAHPKIALDNAKQICSLNAVEEDIILKHMWLITPVPPRYKEGYVVTFVDKFCATREFFISMFSRDVVRTVLSAEG